ncbi:MAG: acetate/propionate family kinase [Candidatus Saccharimonadales bacterium]
MNVLVINAGSSSIKTVLYECDEFQIERLSECTASNIGQDRSSIDMMTQTGDRSSVSTELIDHTAAIGSIINEVPMELVGAIAYRVVYGGVEYFKPTEITDEVQSRLESFNMIDPEHAPISSSIIAMLRDRFPDVHHIACFDTAFFHNLPTLAQIIPIPRIYRDMGIRRFGYHGLSYEYLVDTFGTIAGVDAQHGRVVYAHLGSGSSIMATRDGMPVDMTMGLTPTSGLVMGTRTGDVDPSLAWILGNQADISIEKYQYIINHESGLLAVSELSSDMYALLQNQATNPQADLAVELFCYQARKAIASLSATIGGIDSLIFSGGMGEQAPEIRRRICEGLEFLGIHIDNDANERADRLFSAPDSKVGVHVIPTDESLSIARSIISMNIINKDIH